VEATSALVVHGKSIRKVRRGGESIIGSRAGLRYRENAKILSRFDRDLRASMRAQCLELLQRPEFVTRIP
jgi:hypothetical protein